MSMPVVQDWLPLPIRPRKDGPLSSPTAAGRLPLLRGTMQLTADNSSPLNELLLKMFRDYLYQIPRDKREQPFNVLGDLC